MKNIMVWLTGTLSDTIALSNALQYATPHNAHIHAVHARPDPLKIVRDTMGYDIAGVAVWTEDMIDSVAEGIATAANQARATFEKFCKENDIPAAGKPPGGLCASYSEYVGDAVPVISQHARTHDALVCVRPTAATGLAVDNVETILVRIGRPLVLGVEKYSHIGEHVAIAWKDTPESARAVAAAMPMLKQATYVTIFSAPESKEERDDAIASTSRLRDTLAWNGIKANVEIIAAGSALPEALIEAAMVAKADILVMGAYGHNRAREFILGGFTRALLKNAPMPLFMVH